MTMQKCIFPEFLLFASPVATIPHSHGAVCQLPRELFFWIPSLPLTQKLKIGVLRYLVDKLRIPAALSERSRISRDRPRGKQQAMANQRAIRTHSELVTFFTSFLPQSFPGGSESSTPAEGPGFICLQVCQHVVGF